MLKGQVSGRGGELQGRDARVSLHAPHHSARAGEEIDLLLPDWPRDTYPTEVALWRELVEPRILLYSVPVGGTLELTAFGRGGYPLTVAVHVYGVYRFAGLGDSPISGSYHLMDLMNLMCLLVMSV